MFEGVQAINLVIVNKDDSQAQGSCVRRAESLANVQPVYGTPRVYSKIKREDSTIVRTNINSNLTTTHHSARKCLLPPLDAPLDQHTEQD
jgi:hypothetical protein